MNAYCSIHSLYPFDETVGRIEGALRAAGNTIFARIDQAAAARAAGLSLRPTVAIVFGNPKAGTGLMQTSPAFALELPLKIVVWQGDDGTVTVAYRFLRVLAQTNPIAGQDALLATLDERIGTLLHVALETHPEGT